MSRLPKEYAGLMRDALKEESSASRPLKRRKRTTGSRGGTPGNDSTASASKWDSQTSKESSQEPVAIEVINIESEDEKPQQVLQKDTIRSPSDKPTISNNVTQVIDVDDNDDSEDDDSEDEDDDEFEDVDLENIKPRASSNLTSDVVVTSYDKTKTEAKKAKKKMNVIGKEERQFRKTFHRNHLAFMLVHGSIRNTWCNNKLLQNHLVKLVKPAIYKELHPSSEDTKIVRTRKFLDGLRHLMGIWNKYYKVTSNKGIYRHDWYDWYDLQRSATDFPRFSRCLTRGRGSRDIGAQGFVALLRAAGVPSRLVYSIQSPDFTSTQIKEKRTKQTNETTSDSASLSIKDKVLELRKGKTKVPSSSNPTQAEVEMKYPIFWAEAWDSASKTWITIDPIMFKVIEVVKVKSRLEPPMQDPYNNLLYVIGYDRKGGVRDITKRYAEKYYTKTRRKRITKDVSEEIFFESMIEALSKRGRNKSDDYEDEYFRNKAAKEGMPDSIQDFKNHPFYALEMHLKSNEILHPKEPCGTIRLRNKNEAIPVYRRSNVQLLKSPRGWFQVGRTLKPGSVALKTKMKNIHQIRDDEDDREERLYAEYQTELYVPPPIVDGQITKNAFGNLDVYVPSMIPAGGVLINLPYAEDAAKAIDIDYAKAVIGFKFDRRQVTPKYGGIVVAEEYKDAIEDVEKQLKAQALEKQRLELELRALKGWDLLLTKLRIKQRLNKVHGKVAADDDEIDALDSYDQLESSRNDDVESDGEESTHSEQNAFGNGGFLAADAEFGEEEPRDSGAGFFAEPEEHSGAGGFIPEDEDEEPNVPGGFIPDDDDEEEGETIGAGGFVPEDEEESGAGGFIPEEEDEERAEPEQSYNLPNQDGDNKPYDARDSDELDEFESFFDGLDNMDQDYDSDEDMISVVETPLKKPDPIVSHKPDTHEDRTDTGPSVTQKTKRNLTDPPVPVENELEEINTVDEEFHEDLDSTAPEIPQEPSFDEDLEKEFAEQLKRESQLQAESEDTAAENFDDNSDEVEEEDVSDFVYESD